MELHGKHLIGAEQIAGKSTFRAVNPATSQPIEPSFGEAGAADVDRALNLAESAFDEYRHLPAQRRADFLQAIAAKIEADDALLQRANEETGLPIERLRGERGRTVGQLRLFAKVIIEGSWVAARIDRADPNRKPAPKPDLRRMLIALGPAVVFAASNFPLAFSVAGGDTVSALAAGCPVVVKAHPAHPGTSEWVGRLIQSAAAETKMPAGVFSLLHGRSHELGLALVKHPLTRAVGFTGSLRAGRALFDAAAARKEPIPVYAEMGSTNPVFLLPGALAERGKQIAEGLRQSVTMGVGQFCTNPGLVLAQAGEASSEFAAHLAASISEAAPGTMLYAGLRDSYEAAAKRFAATAGVKIAGQSRVATNAQKTQVAPMVFTADAKTFIANPAIHEELFGPATLLITGSRQELTQIAASLEGHLTATLHATPQDMADHRELIAILERKVGRLLFNGFPTGVEVCPAMQHGGPYPATTDARTTSVGTAAIERFARPICYQDFPPEALPEELRDGNPRGIWRMVDGQMQRKE
ncbi:MAG TPA: aldehyde dehydrogenase (NADP(+)) [Tepidisphaeraceae bacterium]|jgi:NADP-dependent aldehyde dehydrogenase|nr:aldehyde dehydrogenase (NADP(+)) [Tepidisphaeraceae bacterium]